MLIGSPHRVRWFDRKITQGSDDLQRRIHDRPAENKEKNARQDFTGPRVENDKEQRASSA